MNQNSFFLFFREKRNYLAYYFDKSGQGKSSGRQVWSQRMGSLSRLFKVIFHALLRMSVGSSTHKCAQDDDDVDNEDDHITFAIVTIVSPSLCGMQVRNSSQHNDALSYHHH
jgi:hypothetical protein